MSRTIAERVTSGVTYLDEHDPGWWQKGVPNAIDLKALDLGDAKACILGQRCPAERLMRSSAPHPYEAQLRYITRGRGVWVALGEWAAQHGFSADGERPSYYLLTREWRRIIKERRAVTS